MKKAMMILLACTLCLGGALSAAESFASALGKEEMQMLKALQFHDYRHMKISKFQDKVWKLTDTPAYSELLSRLSKDEALYALRDSDETAAFLCYALEPLTKENWRTHAYSGAAVSETCAGGERARLEYVCTLTILDAEKVLVKDYCDTRANVADAMNGLMLGRMNGELQSEEYMLAEIQTFVDDVLPDFQIPELAVSIEYAYFPLPSAEEANRDPGQRLAPNGTEDDYRSLLALKTPNYREMSLADFNAALRTWANEDVERMERIDEDQRSDDCKAPLSEDERGFVEWTAFLSGKENAKHVQSMYSKTPEDDPWHSQYLPVRFGASGGRSGYCSLYYLFSWHIPDKQAVTVGERDENIRGMMQAVQAFWDETDTEALLEMRKADITAKLHEILSAYSTSGLTLSLDEERVMFETIR